MNARITLLAAALCLPFALPTFADEPADPAAGPLARRVETLEGELSQLRRLLETNRSGVDTVADRSFISHTPPCETCPPGYVPATVDHWLGESGFPEARLTGFFQVDAAWFHQSARNRATLGDIQDGAGFRRARLAATGRVTENVSYIVEMDFAASQPRFVDVWLNIGEVPALGNIRVGRWRQPFGMDELTSIREVPFLERNTVFGFGPFRQTGIGAFNHLPNERATWALSGYRYNSDFFGNATSDNGGWGLAGRLTALPLYECDGERLLHLGAGYSFNDPARDRIAFAALPEVEMGQSAGGLLQAPFQGVPFFGNTGPIPTQHLNQLGLEAAAARGPFAVQSELRWVEVELLNGTTETFASTYAQARYVLTGEWIPYQKQAGVFGRIVPDEDFNFHGGRGAWELAARWTYVDLNAAGIPGPGRRLNNLTFGLNWYLNQFTKIQFNYLHAFLNDPTFGDSEAGIAAMRAQLDF